MKYNCIVLVIEFDGGSKSMFFYFFATYLDPGLWNEELKIKYERAPTMILFSRFHENFNINPRHIKPKAQNFLSRKIKTISDFLHYI